LSYYFRRANEIQYSALASNIQYFQYGSLSPDFATRWQKPGDEKFTNVPAISYPANGAADYVYELSDINVLRGDNIRLQEVNMGYSVKMPKSWKLKNFGVFFQVQNIGLIWVANKQHIDPDTYMMSSPPPVTYAFGFRTNF
jgi:hypothetical protein